MKKVKLKRIQIHEQFEDGTNEVYQDELPLRWVDFAKAGARIEAAKLILITIKSINYAVT